MGSLVKLECVPCRGGDPPADEAEIAEYRTQVPDWEILERDEIKRL